MQLLGVEVSGETGRLASAQDTSCLVDVEHSPFTEHVDVVDA